MPATIQELKAVRQELIDKTPLLFQAELLNFWTRLEANTPNLKAPNTFTDARITIIREAIKIWEGGAGSRKHILDLFNTPNSLDDASFLSLTLDALKALKNEKKLLSDYDYKGYIERRRAIPEIYKDWNEEITALEAEKTQLTTDKATAETSLKDYKEKLGTETPEQLKGKIAGLETAKTNAETELNKRPNINLTEYQNLLNNQEKHTTEQLKPADLPDNWKTELEKITPLENEKIALNNQITTLTNESKAKDTTISDQDHTIKDQKKIIDENKDLPDTIKDLNKQLSDKDIELEKRKDTITSLTSERDTARGELGKNDKRRDEMDAYWMTDFKDDFNYAPATLDALKLVRARLNEYLNKILAIYKQQITEQTKAFYSNQLSLDESDDIRPKYKNKLEEMGKDFKTNNYLTLLDNLNGKSEPKEVINAFKLVALVCATEKATKESNEWMKTTAFKNKNLKVSKYKYFKNIKDYWDMLGNLKPKAENNPLYLTYELDQVNTDFLKENINEITELWQK